MTNRERLIMAWEIFRDSNPYEICKGMEFLAIKEPEYCMGQMIEDTIALLKEQEPREITKDEWESWKKAKYRDPLCMYWRGDITPFWILRPEQVCEPAYLIGDVKIFNGKLDKEKIHEIWLKNDRKDGKVE